MAIQESPSWSGFHQAALGRPPRELLVRTLNFFAVEQRAPGVAVDLGCGSGPDTRELIRRGWQVHAVDSDPSGLELLRESIPPDRRTHLHVHVAPFQSFEFPLCDLIWASYALPFCPIADWPALVLRAVASLNVGGRMAGDIFGNKHAWAAESDVLTLTEEDARAALRSLSLEAFDVEDGLRVSGNEKTRWHAFGFTACKNAGTP